MEFKGKRPFGLLLLLLFSIAIVLAILFDIVPFLRGGFGWRWPYLQPSWQTFKTLLPGILGLILYLIGVKVLFRRKTVVYLLWVFLGSLLLPIAFLRVMGQPFYTLYTRTVSILTTGAYFKATEFSSLSELLQQWPNHMGVEVGHTHISISPPGWPALYLQTTKLLTIRAFPRFNKSCRQHR